MDEKTIQRIKKLQALAERGVGGEKTTAQKKLAKLLKDNGINSLDELQKDDYDGCCIYAYYGKIQINNDGKDGKDIDVEAIGYLEGYQEHKEESGAGE